MKWLVLVLGLGLFALPVGSLHAQTATLGSFSSIAMPIESAPPDSIVAVTAENQGLSLIAREDLPLTGTYWLITSNAWALPMPCAPLDQSIPIYAISDTVFLADGTKGMAALSPHRAGYGTVDDVLAAQANAVENLVSQNEAMQMRPMLRAMSMDSSSPIDGLSLGSFTNDAANYTWDTNQLWLEITNVTTDTTFANLHHATNQVYAIWSATNLATPLNQWQVATELWPTDTNCQPFSVPSFAAQNLFLRAEDWTGIDSDGDGIPDWWIWKYFGDLSETATNLDSQGNTLGYDYTNSLDPNVISFSVSLGNQNFNTTTASGEFEVTAGNPSYWTVLVNDTNLDDAVWLPYDGNILMNLGSTDGVYQVTFGLKGRASDSTVTWMGTDVTLNRQTPQITLTSVANGVVAQPWFQLQGYAAMPLAKVTYDLNGQTNQLGFIIDHTLDTNAFTYTTDYFQCYDLPLVAGTNAITLHATDPAGNTFTTNISVTLDYSTATNPVINLTWPQDKLELCGSNFTVRGWTEDAAAQVSATITDSSGDTNTFAGTVERTGKVWVENLPLNPGTNFITLTVTNAAGLSSATNFTVVKSDMTLTLTSIDGDLWSATVNVGGTISDTSAAITVNGVQGTNNGDGTWSAGKVPVTDGGIASFEVNATPTNSSDPAVSPNFVKPDETKLESGIWHAENYWHYFDDLMGDYDFEYSQNDWAWSEKTGGAGHYLMTAVNYFLSWDFTIAQDKSIPFDHYADSTGQDYYTNGIAVTDDNFWLGDALQQFGAVKAFGSNPKDIWIKKSATVKVVFHTGGQAVAGQQSLYVVSGSATKQEAGRNSAFATIVDKTNVPPEQVTVPGLGKNLDADSVASAALPNPPKVDVTLGAPVPRDKFPVGGSRNVPVIAWTGGAPITNTQNVIVGQAINLTCGWLGGSGPTITNFQWSVPGYAISNFYVSPDTSTGMVVEPFPKTNSGVNFYWVDGGSKDVSCDVTVMGQTLTAKATFDVLRPTATLTVQMSTNQPPVSIGNAGYPGDGITLHPGSYASPASTWIGIVTAPINGAGAIAFTQLAAPDRHIRFTNNVAQKWTSNGTNMLDGRFGVQYDGETPIESGGARSIIRSDTPEQGVDGLKHVSANDHFQTFLMYKYGGDSGNSIWVTLQTFSWSWGGTADSGTNGVWSLSGISLTNTPSIDSTALPQWKGSAGNLQWVSE